MRMAREGIFLVFTVMYALAAAEEAAKPHQWSFIAYPELPSLDVGVALPTIRISSKEQRKMRLDLIYSVALGHTYKNTVPPAAKSLGIRFHYPDGAIVEAACVHDGVAGFGNSRAQSHDMIFEVPWRKNVLEETWFEATINGTRYWFEIPYGFTRNPSDPLKLDEEKSGEPGLAPAMKQLGEKDKVVRWQFVRYDLGKIEHGWRLSVDQSNPFDARAEIELYRDDSKNGKSIFLWELHTPRTALNIAYSSSTAGGFCMSIRLHEDGMRRSDAFKFNRNLNGHSRVWGTMFVQVDDKTHSFTLPSSLFKYVHGCADPYNKAAINR